MPDDYFRPDKREPEHVVYVQPLLNCSRRCKKAEKPSEVLREDLVDMLNYWNYYVQSLYEHRTDGLTAYKPMLAHWIDIYGSADVLEKLGFSKQQAQLLLKTDYFNLTRMIRSIEDGEYTAKDVNKALNEVLKTQKDKSDIVSAIDKAINKIEAQIAEISENENTNQYYTQSTNNTIYI